MENDEAELIDVAPGLWLWQVHIANGREARDGMGKLLVPAWNLAVELLCLIR
jgi:hypothetical protein